MINIHGSSQVCPGCCIIWPFHVRDGVSWFQWQVWSRPKIHPHLTFPAQDSKVQNLCKSFVSNLREEGHGALLRVGEIFMKRQHHFHSCVSGLGDLPQTGFWIRLHWISVPNLFLTGFLSSFTVPVPAQHFVYPGLWHLFLLHVFFQSL